MPGIYYKLHKKMHKDKRFFIHFHGSELRHNINTKHNDLARKLFVSTPDLKEYSHFVGGRELVWIPNPLPIDEIPFKKMIWPEGVGKKVPLKIIHMPTHRVAKGTPAIETAVKRLTKQGYLIDLAIVENLPNDLAMKRLSDSHICIDSCNRLKHYCMVSIEAMARGVPAITSYDPGLFKAPPIIVARPKTLEHVLKEMIDEKMDPTKLSIEGRTYVKRVHDPLRVTKLLLSHYMD